MSEDYRKGWEIGRILSEIITRRDERLQGISDALSGRDVPEPPQDELAALRAENERLRQRNEAKLSDIHNLLATIDSLREDAEIGALVRRMRVGAGLARTEVEWLVELHDRNLWRTVHEGLLAAVQKIAEPEDE